MLPQLLKHLFKLSEVVCNTAAVHDDVLQVHQEDRICSSSLWKIVCINFWKRAGALHNVKGIQLYSIKPIGVVNAVLCQSSGCTTT